MGQPIGPEGGAVNRADEHRAFEELAVGHAVSALEPDEERIFLEHVRSCARCEADLAEHRSTLELLAYASDPAEPPPSILEGIRAGMRAGASTELGGGQRSHRVEAAASSTQIVTSLDEARARRVARLPPAARWTGVAAAAALVVSLGAWNLTLRADQDAAAQREQRLAVAVGQLTTAGATNVQLAGEDGQVVAVAVVTDDDVSLVVNGLTPNSGDSSYVLWTQDRQGALRPVSAFDVASSDVDVVAGLDVEGGTAAVAAFAVSRERGSTPPPQPLGPVVASGEA